MDAARATTIIVQFVPSDEGGRSVEIEQQQDRRNKRQRQQQNCCLTRRGVSTIINSIIDTSLVQLTGYASDKTWALSSEENQKEFIEESSASCWCLKVGLNTINMRPTLEPFCSACS
ncbi:hypothetical protein OUZ56_008309 [Daphnia magna]|uniref:Uncharacterized protein n=1 Tax=Daphnia magna TaxID=35525 RepID=A0ABR0ACK4_9CRUS|nr:hypothetical protein OUZ56_008309 [Daphnia magna]